MVPKPTLPIKPMIRNKNFESPTLALANDVHEYLFLSGLKSFSHTHFCVDRLHTVAPIIVILYSLVSLHSSPITSFRQQLLSFKSWSSAPALIGLVAPCITVCTQNALFIVLTFLSQDNRGITVTIGWKAIILANA